jgi:hypothetical protein
MRGGDYFFVPGLGALRDLAEGKTFPASPDDPSWLETSIGKLKPKPPLDPDTLFELGREKLLGPSAEPYISMVLPNFVEHPHAKVRDYTIVFIGRYKNVLKVLHDEQHFSVRPYEDAIARITGGENMIVGMPSGDSERSARMQIWNDAEKAYNTDPRST